MKHEYYYVGNRLQYEKYDDIELWFFYDADGNPSGVRYDWDGLVLNYYFVCNWRGDVVQIYKENGALHVSYEYDAWGNVLSVRSANGAIISSTYNIATIKPLRYRGYYYDSETGMYYLKSRYYDPATKRFLNADGLVSSSIEDVAKNMFTYCLNNPVIYVDSEGNCPYKPTSYDFYRLNHGLPAAGCTCNTKKEPVKPDNNTGDSTAVVYTEKVIVPALKEILTSHADDVLESIILPNAVLSPLLISEMSDMVISGLRNAGIASLAFACAEIGWDFYKYCNTDINKFYISATITLAGIAATAVIGAVIVPELGLVGAGAAAATIIGGIAVGYVEDWAKKHFLG